MNKTNVIEITAELKDVKYYVRVNGKIVATSLTPSTQHSFLDAITKAFDAAKVPYTMNKDFKS